MPRQRNLSQVLSVTPNTTGSFILGCSGFQVWRERGRHYFKKYTFPSNFSWGYWLVEDPSIHYTECQAFSPVVRIGSYRPLPPQASVASSPPLVPRRAGHTPLRERGRGEPRGEEATLACGRGGGRSQGGRRQHLLAGEGAGGANSDEGTDTLVSRYSIV